MGPDRERKYYDDFRQSARFAEQLNARYSAVVEKAVAETPEPPAPREPAPPPLPVEPPAPRPLAPDDNCTLTLKVLTRTRNYAAATSATDLEAMLRAEKDNKALIDVMVRNGRLCVAQSRTHRVSIVSILPDGLASVKIEADSDHGKKLLPFRKAHSLGVTYCAPTLVVPVEWLERSGAPGRSIFRGDR